MYTLCAVIMQVFLTFAYHNLGAVPVEIIKYYKLSPCIVVFFYSKLEFHSVR